MNNNLNLIFDIEGTSGSYLWADPISISYIVVAGMEENFKIIQPMRTYKARSRKSRCYEIDAYLVNGLDPYKVEKEKLTNFQLIKKIHEEFLFWGKKGANFICYNGYSYDFSLIEANLHSQLFDWIWIFNTGGASKVDMLPICRNIEYYKPGSIKTEKNEKQNKIFRLQSVCFQNNFLRVQSPQGRVFVEARKYTSCAVRCGVVYQRRSRPGRSIQVRAGRCSIHVRVTCRV